MREQQNTTAGAGAAAMREDDPLGFLAGDPDLELRFLDYVLEREPMRVDCGDLAGSWMPDNGR